MDLLGSALAPYSESIAKFASNVTCLQFLSGIFLLNEIRKQGSSDKYRPEPFIGGIILSALSLKLGMIMGDAAMIRVNIFGIIVSKIFTLVFYMYASTASKKTIWSMLGIGAAFIMACFAYASIEAPEKIESRFGILITVLLVYLVGSPLLGLSDIIKNQSTEGLPFPIILSGTIVAASWTTYGLSIKNEVLTYQNLLLFVLSSIQLSLFAIYPRTPAAKTKKTSKQKNKAKSIPNKNQLHQKDE